MRGTRVIVALLCALSGVQALAVRCDTCPKMPCCDEESSSQAKIAELPPCCRLKQTAAPANRPVTLVEHQSHSGPALAAAWPPAPIVSHHALAAPPTVRACESPPLYRLNCALLL